jgi:acetylornithine deacetylase/succinyl-diaminopimelate desuccinylase-like protein
MKTANLPIERYLEERKTILEDELKAFLSIPSISTDSKFHSAVRDAAKFVKENLIVAGVSKAEILETEGLPIVYAEKFIHKDLPTILIYGHYDVQPPGPSEEWETPPFEPTIRDGKIFARGACDDKAQMMIPIKAFEYSNQTGDLAYNLKFLFEGEEEVGSRSLLPFIQANRELLGADAALIVDTFLHDVETPAIIYGVKGAILVEISLQGADEDKHSGMDSGIVKNTAEELAFLLTSFKEENGKARIDKFYDGMQAPTEQDFTHLQNLARVNQQEESKAKRQGFMPSLEINGMTSGYTGEGVKTIIPARASAKISIRTVPGQNSTVIVEELKKHLTTQLRDSSFTLTIETSIPCEPAVMDTSHWVFQAAEKACEKEFNNAIVYKRIGGSIPVVGFLTEALNTPSLLLGFGLESDSIHAPNEHYHLTNYYRGIRTLTHFLSHQD